MAGTLKLWWHDGSTLDARSHPTPLINEPERGFESHTVGTTPVSTGPAPSDCYVAVVETTVPIRYRILAPGQTGSAADPEAKPLNATGFAVATVGIVPGAVLSVMEVV